MASVPPPARPRRLRVRNAFRPVIAFIANLSQGKQIREHAARVGRIASVGPSIGIGFVGLLVLATVFAVILLTDPTFGPAVRIGNDEVYYAGEATEDDARKLAEELKNLEFFGNAGASVRIESKSGSRTVSFVLGHNKWNDAEIVKDFTAVGIALAQAGIGQPLTIQLCDDEFNAKKTIPIVSVESLVPDEPPNDE